MHIESVEQLRTLYGAAKERALKKEMTSLDVHCRQFIALSPFIVIGSGDSAGQLDASPRGGVPGFVKVLDGHTILIPDSAGNNRLDTLENILSAREVGLLFLIPGMDETLRINGVASLHTDAEYLTRCASELKSPKLVIKVRVRQAYLHCAKAFMRSKLWEVSSKIDRQVMPTMNEMIGSQTGIHAETQEETFKRHLTEL
jgi:PPOX class probable FMN-dependent enzyme